MTLTYSIKHLRRHFREGILSVALVLVITVLLLGLLHFLDGQETQLAYVYDTFEIECVLSNATGTQTKDISIPANVADMFLDGGVLTPYVKNVCMETYQRAILLSVGKITDEFKIDNQKIVTSQSLWLPLTQQAQGLCTNINQFIGVIK